MADDLDVLIARHADAPMTLGDMLASVGPLFEKVGERLRKLESVDVMTHIRDERGQLAQTFKGRIESYTDLEKRLAALETRLAERGIP